MTSIYWTWAAVVAELGLFLSPLLLSRSSGSLAFVLTAHMAASAVVASSTYVLQPRVFKKPRAMVWLLLFEFALIAPVIGAVGLLLLSRYSLQRTASRNLQATPVSVNLPQYDVQAKDVNRSGQGALRSRLVAGVPGAIRMQSLITLQSIPTRVANPILEDLLGDGTDDVRLVAFGMLDAGEKKITSQIQMETKNLKTELNSERRLVCLKHLAELHWELIYSSLAQGELRRHILTQAAGYVSAAMELGLPQSPALTFLHARILLAQGHTDAAKQALEEAIVQGQPLASALPYLAEIAFNRREFDQVRQCMQRVSTLQIADKTRAVADIWTGRDRLQAIVDRRFLPHV